MKEVKTDGVRALNY